MDQSIFINYNKIFSYNSFINFIIGERGVGKSYGISKYVVKDFIKNKNEFVYIRRTKEELKKSVPKFFDPLIVNNEFPKNKLVSSSYKELKIDGSTAGYCLSLKAQQSYKSVNFSRVKTIIFDEFLAEDGVYLKNEVHKFLNLIETVGRMRDDLKIFLLANPSSITNPYFLEFNLSLPYKNTAKTYKNGLILVYYSDNEAYREAKKNTKFGKLIENTEFEDFAINNKFIFDDSHFIEKKTPTSTYYFAFTYQTSTFGVWIDNKIGKIFISSDYNKNSTIFATTLENHAENTLFINNAKRYKCWKKVIENYKMGNVFFENQKIKNQALEVIKMFIRA